MRLSSITVLLFCFTCGVASGQRITLQAPIIAQFSVRTTVVAPDRGGALLGSVSRAASGYKTLGPGPLPRGRSIGRTIEHRSVRSHVYIHDFQAMDPFLRGRRPPVQRVDPVQEKNERVSRAASAYAKLAEKAESKGNEKLASWYRKKAHEYAQKTQLAKRAGSSNRTQP